MRQESRGEGVGGGGDKPRRQVGTPVVDEQDRSEAGSWQRM